MASAMSFSATAAASLPSAAMAELLRAFAWLSLSCKSTQHLSRHHAQCLCAELVAHSRHCHARSHVFKSSMLYYCHGEQGIGAKHTPPRWSADE